MKSQFAVRSHFNFFWRCHVFLFFLVKFSYLSKFHVNIITCSRVTTIFVYKGLTRNPEIGNNSVCALSNIWRLRRVKNAKFGRNVSNEKLGVLDKLQIWGFEVFTFWSKFRFCESSSAGPISLLSLRHLYSLLLRRRFKSEYIWIFFLCDTSWLVKLSLLRFTWYYYCRSNQRRCSVKKKGVLKSFVKFTKKQLRWSLFFTEVDACWDLQHH